MINGVFSSSMFATRQYASGHSLPSSISNQNAPPNGADQLTLNGVSSLKAITQGHDIRHISPREMSALSHRLYENGSISLQDHALMSFQPELGPDLLPGMDTGAKVDVPRDFIQHWEKQIEPFSYKL